MNLTSRNKFFIWLITSLFISLLLLYKLINAPLSINANISALFSESSGNDWQVIEKKIANKVNTSQLYLIGHEQIDIAISAAETLAKQLNGIANITQVSVRLDNIPDQQTMIDSYQGFAQQLLSNDFRYILQNANQSNNNHEALFNKQFALLNQLGDQLVPLTITQDQTLAFADYLNRSPFPSSRLNVTEHGYLTVAGQNKSYVMLSFKTSQGALNIAATSAIVNALDNLALQPDIEYLRTGAIFYSAQASTQATFEMQLFSVLSLLAVLLLIFLSYRRTAAILSTMLVIALSVLYGFIGLQLFFTEINILALVFAITIIGIAVDYSFHSLTELQSVARDHQAPLKAIFNSLMLGFFTTALGYLLLTFVPIELFKQIAVFTVFGLLGALLTVLLLFPYLHQRVDFSQSSAGSATEQNNNHFYSQVNYYHQQFIAKYAAKVALLSIAVVIILIAVRAPVFSDNAKSFYQPSAQLVSAENKIKTLLGQKFDNQYLLLKAADKQQLLEQEESVLVLLEQLKKQQVITDYQAVASWLPSIKQQKENNQLLLNAVQNKSFTALAQLFGQDNLMVSASEQYLLPEQWFTSNFGKTFGHLWLSESDGEYSLIRFVGINNSATLASALANTLTSPLADHNNFLFVDKLAQTAQQLAHFRQVLLIIFIAAALAALLVFYCRYGFKKAMVAIAIPVSAFVIALILSGFLQANLTLFNLAAGLVILALGLDYSVFYAEHGFSVAITQTTLMSALSSIFVFAILSFSSTPAIASFGQTVFFGILLNFLFAPLVTCYLGKRTVDEH